MTDRGLDNIDFTNTLRDFTKATEQEPLQLGFEIRNAETAQQDIIKRYRREVYEPRLEFWNRFNEFVKGYTPNWTNPDILAPENNK